MRSIISEEIEKSKSDFAKGSMFAPGLVNAKGGYVPGSYEGMKELPGNESPQRGGGVRGVPAIAMNMNAPIYSQPKPTSPGAGTGKRLVPADSDEGLLAMTQNLDSNQDETEEEVDGLAKGGKLDQESAHLVGEEGAELILPTGDGYQVVPADKTRQIMAKGGISPKPHASGGYIEDYLKQGWGDPNQPLINTNVPAMPQKDAGAQVEGMLQQRYGSANQPVINTTTPDIPPIPRKEVAPQMAGKLDQGWGTSQPLVNTAGLITDGTVETIPNPRPMTDQRNIPGGTMPTPGTDELPNILGPRAKPGEPMKFNTALPEEAARRAGGALGPRAQPGEPMRFNTALPEEAARRIGSVIPSMPGIPKSDLGTLGVRGEENQAQYNPQVVNQPSLWQRLNVALPVSDAQTISPDPMAPAPVSIPTQKPVQPTRESAQPTAGPVQAQPTVTPQATTPATQAAQAIQGNPAQPLANPKTLSGAVKGTTQPQQPGNSAGRPIELIRGTQRTYVNPATSKPGGFFSNPQEYNTPGEAMRGMTLGEDIARQRLANQIAKEDLKGQYDLLREAAKNRSEKPLIAKDDDILIDPTTRQPIGRAGELMDASKAPPPMTADLSKDLEEIMKAPKEEKARILARHPEARQKALFDRMDDKTQRSITGAYEEFRKSLSTKQTK